MVLSVESVHLAKVAARCVVLRWVNQILLIAPARQILSINVSALRLELLPLFFLSGHLLAQFLGNEFILFDGLGSLFLLIPLIDPRIALITFDIWYFSVLSQLHLFQAALQGVLFFVFHLRVVNFLRSLSILLLQPSIEVAVKRALFLSYALLINYLAFHG